METGDKKEATHLFYLRGAEREVWKGLLRIKVMGRGGKKHLLGFQRSAAEARLALLLHPARYR